MLHIEFALSLILSVLTLALVGAICSVPSIFHTVRQRFLVTTTFSYRLLLSAMASVGLMMILQQGTLLVFGTEERGIQSPFPQIIDVLDVRVSLLRLIVIVVSIVICLLLYLLMYRTKLGKILRAVSYDPEAVTLQGIDTFWIFVFCFALGSALAGVAGGVIAPLFGHSFYGAGCDISLPAGVARWRYRQL